MANLLLKIKRTVLNLKVKIFRFISINNIVKADKNEITVIYIFGNNSL